jgi:hypothetical protein
VRGEKKEERHCVFCIFTIVVNNKYDESEQNCEKRGGVGGNNHFIERERFVSKWVALRIGLKSKKII